MMSGVSSAVPKTNAQAPAANGLGKDKNDIVDFSKGDEGAKQAEDVGDFLNRITKHQRAEGEQNKNPMASKALGKDDFLKFFMASLKNQDPSKPVDAEQFSSQMAQFSSLQQLVNLNKGLDKIAESNRPDKSMQALSMMGKQVVVDGSRMEVKNGLLKPIQLESPSDVTKLKVTIADSSGAPVKTISIDSKNKGKFEVIWDGKTDEGHKAVDGKYTYKAEALDAEGRKVELTTERKLVIDGVDMNSRGERLFSGGQVVKIDEIKMVSDPALTAKDATEASPVAPTSAPTAGVTPSKPGKASSVSEKTAAMTKDHEMKTKDIVAEHARKDMDAKAGKTPAPKKSV